MTPDTLEYLKSVLTEKVITGVSEIQSWAFPAESEPYKDLMKAHTALKEVRRAIRRAENRAARKQERS